MYNYEHVLLSFLHVIPTYPTHYGKMQGILCHKLCGYPENKTRAVRPSPACHNIRLLTVV